MELTLNRVEFAKALFAASQTVGSTKSIQLHVADLQLLFEKKKLYLYTFDGNNFSETLFGDVDCLDFSCTVNFDLMNKTVLQSSEEEIKLSIENNSLILSDSESEYRMQVGHNFNNSNMFRPLDTSFAKPLKLELSRMRSILAFVGACLPTPADLNHLKGVYFDGNFVTTDTRKLALFPYSDPIPNSVFLSNLAMELLTSLSDIHESAQLYCSKNRCVVILDNAKYILSVMAKDFPGYKKATDRLESHEFIIDINRDELRKKCKRLLPFADSRKKGTANLFISKDKLRIEVISEVKRGKESMSIITKNLEIEMNFTIGLNSFYDLLGHFTDDQISISFGKDMKLYKIWSTAPFFVETTYNL